MVLEEMTLLLFVSGHAIQVKDGFRGKISPSFSEVLQNFFTLGFLSFHQLSL